jgi:hypothetical protein
MTTAELDGLLNAHAYLRVERPPSLWGPQSELEPFVRMLGELIVVGLLRNGNVLGELTLNVSNVVVEPASAGPMPAGAFVAVTIRGRGDWSPETTWPASATTGSGLESAQAAAHVAGAVYLYSRVLGDDDGSVTVLLPTNSGQSSSEGH